MVKQKIEADPSLGPEFVHFKYIVGLMVVCIGLLCKTVICALLPQVRIYTIGRNLLLQLQPSAIFLNYTSAVS